MRDLMLTPTFYPALHSDDIFLVADVSDDEGMDSPSRVAISPDQDEPTRHDDWFSDDEQEPL